MVHEAAEHPLVADSLVRRVLAGTLAAFGISVYLLMQRGLQIRTSESLLIQMTVIEDQFSHPQGRWVLQDRLERQYARHPAFDIQVTDVDGTIWMGIGSATAGCRRHRSLPVQVVTSSTTSPSWAWVGSGWSAGSPTATAFRWSFRLPRCWKRMTNSSAS